jgi:hypothetical protein
MKLTLKAKTAALGAFAAGTFTLTASTAAHACVVGDTACPQDLHFSPGAVSITVNGTLSADHPSHEFRIAARRGQTLLVSEQGASIRGQLFLQGPNPANSEGDDFTTDTPYKLPATGAYTFTFIANTMAEGAYGPFHATVTVK